MNEPRVVHASPKLMCASSLLSLCLAFLVTSALCAQSDDFARTGYERFAPQQPPPILSEPRVSNQDSIAFPVSSSEEVLVEKLNGFVFMNTVDEAEYAGLASAEPVTSRNGVLLWKMEVPNPKAFRRIVQPYIGAELSMRKLDEVQRDIVQYYREQGRPLVDVIVPEQVMREGVVQIAIVEGRLGKVVVKGNEHFPTESYQQAVTVSPGQAVDDRQLKRDVAYINNNPFRQVEMAYEAGSNPGETDVVLYAADRRPWRVYGGFEDTGNQLTEYGRLLGGFNWGDVWGRGHQLSYQYMTSTEPNLLQAHSLSYVLPLHNGHSATVFGSYSESGADFPIAGLDLEGEGWQTSLRYTIPLQGSDDSYTHKLTLGVDYKRSDNELIFNTARLSNTQTEVVQAMASYNVSKQSDYGVTSFGASVFASPGGMSGENEDVDFIAAGADSADYQYARIKASHTHNLALEMTLQARLLAQLSSERLLGSEQLGLGGYNNVRGYDSREVNGDEGYFASLELRTKPFALSGILDDELLVTFLGFTDYGNVSPETTRPGEDPHAELWSIGFGTRVNYSPYASLRFDYGWQMNDSGASSLSRDGDNHRGHVGMTVSY